MKYINRDITSVTRGVIVHGVNCMGEINSGVALSIRNKWPEVYSRYKLMPTGKEMLGTTHITNVANDLYVANCYTQSQFGYDGEVYADIHSVEKCLHDCYSFANVHGLPLCSVKIASGRGGLDWESEVEPIFTLLNSGYTNVNVEIYHIRE